MKRSAARDYAPAMLCVYVGTGLLDGFGDRDLSRLAGGFRRYLPFALAAAVAVGLLLHGYHARLLARPAPA